MTRIYLDSSALMKRVFDEAESGALRDGLMRAHEAETHLVTSSLARVEVARATRTRIDAGLPANATLAATDAMDGIATAHLTRAIMESARTIGPPVLRTLDAIHLATAVALAADEIWTYDARMAQTAEELGIPVRTPGRDSIAG